MDDFLGTVVKFVLAEELNNQDKVFHGSHPDQEIDLLKDTEQAITRFLNRILHLRCTLYVFSCIGFTLAKF